jgi:hypothetical protein
MPGASLTDADGPALFLKGIMRGRSSLSHHGFNLGGTASEKHHYNIAIRTMKKKKWLQIIYYFGCKRRSLEDNDMGPSPDDRDRLNIIDTTVL